MNATTPTPSPANFVDPTVLAAVEAEVEGKTESQRQVGLARLAVRAREAARSDVAADVAQVRANAAERLAKLRVLQDVELELARRSAERSQRRTAVLAFVGSVALALGAFFCVRSPAPSPAATARLEAPAAVVTAATAPTETVTAVAAAPVATVPVATTPARRAKHKEPVVETTTTTSTARCAGDPNDPLNGQLGC